MSGYTRKSAIAPYIDGLLAEKHANGYEYKSEELILDRFDRYCFSEGITDIRITKEDLGGWMERTTTEGEFFHGKRISTVRQLLLHMAACGIEVYIPHDFCHFTRALPHIFDPVEIEEFFCVMDSYVPRKNRPAEVRLHNEYKLMFRLYYCTGMRNSEVAGIATEQVDFENGIFTILDSKGNKDRLVYLSEDLTDSCKLYFEYLQDVLGFRPHWFFPGIDPDKPVPNTSMARVFNRFWERTCFAEHNNKPTIHDFRFSFVVRRMNRWAERDVDLKVMLPYLSRYLGHKSTKETFYYYFMVDDTYKTIARKDTIAGSVIPEVLYE